MFNGFPNFSSAFAPFTAPFTGATDDTFRNNLHEQGKRMLEMNQRLQSRQLDAWKQGEKAMLQGIEQSRHAMELSLDLQKAAWKSWLDMMAPKSEKAEKSEKTAAQG